MKLRSWPLAALLLLLTSCGDAAMPTALHEIVPSAEMVQFGALVNEYRATLGCPALQWDGPIAEVAQQHSEDMAKRNFFGYTNPDGKSPFDRLREAGVGYRAAGENIATGFPTAQRVLEGWLASPPHRANIEDCEFTRYGIGLYEERWTHVLLMPR